MQNICEIDAIDAFIDAIDAFIDAQDAIECNRMPQVWCFKYKCNNPLQTNRTPGCDYISYCTCTSYLYLYNTF